MGQAKRRKDIGAYPEVRPKPRAITRLKRDPLEVDTYLGTSSALSLLSLLSKRTGQRGEVRE